MHGGQKDGLAASQVRYEQVNCGSASPFRPCRRPRRRHRSDGIPPAILERDICLPVNDLYGIVCHAFDHHFTLLGLLSLRTLHLRVA